MVPVALKLPLWNDPPTFLAHLESQESKKTGGTWSGEKTPYPQILDTGRRTTPQVACIPILFIFDIYFAFIIFV